MARPHCPVAGQRAENNWCLALLLTGRVRKLFTSQKGTFLMVQWLSNRLPMQGIWVQSLPNAGGVGLVRFHMLWSNSPCTTTTEASLEPAL